jgi:TonB family protein
MNSTIGNNGYHKAGHNGSTISARNGSFAPPRAAVRPSRVRPAVEAPRRRPSHAGADLDDVAATSSPGWSAALRGALVISVAMFAWMAWSQPGTTSRGANRTVTSASSALRVPAGDGRYFRGQEDAGASVVAALIKRPESLDAESKPGRSAGGDASPGAASAAGRNDGAPGTSAVAAAASLPIDGRGADGSSHSRKLERSTSRKEAGITRRTSVAIRQEPVKAPPPKQTVVVEQPRVTYQPKPAYPQAALVSGREQEGSVRVKMLISPTGTVSKLEIVDSTPPGVFDDSVKEVLPHWRFIPAKDDTGKPVEFWKQFNYVFKLQVGS